MKKGLTFIFILLSSFFLYSCENGNREFKGDTIYSMNTSISISVPKDITSNANYEIVFNEVKETFEFLHALTDNFNDGSNNKDVISSIFYINEVLKNSLEETETFEINFELFEMLNTAKELEELTNGYFNISIGRIIDIWKENVITYDGEFVPESIILETLEEASEIEVVRNAFTLLEEDNQYYVTIDTRVQIDLGAIAKGYGLEKAVEIFAGNNKANMVIEQYIISAGTSSLAVGNNPNRDNGFYRIGLINPNKWDDFINPYYGIINAKETKITTSGNYIQSIIGEDEKLYHHLISPLEKQPVNYYQTLTIIDQMDAGRADALSTALYLMDEEKLETFLSQNQYEVITFSNNSYKHYNQSHEIEDRLS